MDCTGRTVLITGASGNLGRAVAEAFAAQGANLVLIDRNAQHLAQTFGAESARRMFAVVDLLDGAQVAAMAAKAAERFRRLDALCNIAGGFTMGEPVHATSDATWQMMFDLNARTLLNAVRAVVPRMLEAGGGAIVNVGAFAAQKGAAQMGAYTASKSVVIRLTEAMAGELREKGINVNCVLPTVIDTPENRKSMPDVDPARWVAPHDLANVIVFLASPAARAIHGAALPVTGLS
jgi:NAD(P)-dependent dehydrogenase (short-subunit alcohol dehydrogenase family)